MKAFLGKYKYILLGSFATLSLLVGGATWALLHPEATIAWATKKFLGQSLEIEEVKLEKHRLALQGIHMEIDGEPFLEIPEILAERTSFARLGEISIPTAEVFIRRKEDGWNVQKFSSSKKKTEEEKDYTKYKPADLHFRGIEIGDLHLSLEDEVKKFKKDINLRAEGSVKESGALSLAVKGKGEEVIDIHYGNDSYPYELEVQLGKIELKEALQSYAPSLAIEPLPLSADLRINPVERLGYVKTGFHSLKVGAKEWKQGELLLSLEEEKALLELDYLEAGSPKEASLNYDFKTKKLEAEMEDIFYDTIEVDLAPKQEGYHLDFAAASGIYPPLKGEADVKLGKEMLELKLKSNIIELEGEYNSLAKTLLLRQGSEAALFYDVTEKNLVEASGVWKAALYDYELDLDMLAENNQVSINALKISSEEKGELDLRGDLNLEELAFHFDYDARHFIWAGENYHAQASLEGRLDYSKKENFFATAKGELEEVAYGKYALSGFKLDLDYEDQLLEVYQLENRAVAAKGVLDFFGAETAMDLEIRGLDSELLHMEALHFAIQKADAKLFGNLRNPSMDLNLEEGSFQVIAGRNSQLSGEANLRDFVVSFDKINFDQNQVSGSYNIKDQSYQGKAIIIEEKLGDYYSYYDLSYRVIGEAIVKGRGRELEVRAKSNIDKVYYQGKALPKISWEGSYQLGASGLGRLNFTKVELKNKRNRHLLDLTGKIDLDTKMLDWQIAKQELSWRDIEDYTHLDFIKGKFSLEGSLEGSYLDPKYSLKLDGNNFKVKEAAVDSVILEIAGNKKAVKIQKAEANYSHNHLSIAGDYAFSGEDYRIEVKAPKLDWSLLEGFVKDAGLEALKGESDLDVVLSPKGLDGDFALHQISFALPKKHLLVEDLEGSFAFQDKDITLRSLEAKINQGKLKMDGKLRLPEMGKVKEDLDFVDTLSYSLHLHLKDMHYDIPEMLSMRLSSSLQLEENKLRGNIEILEAAVEDIPNEYQSYWSILKKFFGKKEVEKKVVLKEVKEEAPWKKALRRNLDLHVSLLIRDAIKCNIPSLNVAVEEVKGRIIGGLSLSGKNGKYSLLGNVEAEEASLMVNSNTFVLDKALISFNDAKSYLPEVKPTLNIDSVVEVNGDPVRFAIQGRVDKLSFSISSKTGSTSGSLDSLLSGKINVNEDNSSYIDLLRNLIGGQLAQSVIGPITKQIRRLFHVERLRVTSNVSNAKAEDKGGKDAIELGAKIEIRDNLYKDKIYWNFVGDLYNSTWDVDSKGGRGRENRVLDEYEFSIQYPYAPSKAFEIGVGRMSAQHKKEETPDSRGNLNYFVGWKIEKKMNSILDLFRE